MEQIMIEGNYSFGIRNGPLRYTTIQGYEDRWGRQVRIIPFDGGPSIEVRTYSDGAGQTQVTCHVGDGGSFGSASTLRRWALAIRLAAEVVKHLTEREELTQALVAEVIGHYEETNNG